MFSKDFLQKRSSNRIVCGECGKDVPKYQFNKHVGSKQCLKIKQFDKNFYSNNIIEGDNCFICGICSKSYNTKHGLISHISQIHDEKNLNKIRISKKRVAWNKGLTKETSDIIANYAEALSKSQKGKKGKKHTEASRQKSSKSKIEYLKNNPDKVPYLINHSSKESYPERIFREALERYNIKGWVSEYRNGIYQYDFAFIDLKIDIEIDGGTHESEKVKLIDERRDNFSKSLGWIVIRFKAKDVKRDVSRCIEELKLVLRSFA